MRKVMLLVGIAMLCVCCAPKMAQVRTMSAEDSDKAVSAWSDARCNSVMDKRDNVLLVAKILAGVGGASAITTAVPEWDENVRWGIGAGAATAAIVGGALLWYGEQKNDEFEENCEIVP